MTVSFELKKYIKEIDIEIKDLLIEIRDYENDEKYPISLIEQEYPRYTYLVTFRKNLQKFLELLAC